MVKFYFILTFILVQACGDNSFVSGGAIGQGASSKNPTVDAHNENGNGDHTRVFENGDQYDNRNFGNNNFGNFTQGNNWTNKGLGNGSGSDSLLNDPEKCWFAVSGAYFGCHGNGDCNSYGTVFPGTLSGNPIAHGESFDNVGGIYLNTSDAAYEVGKGGMEIDQAVASSFDSIAISPGVSVEILDGSGNVLLNAEGPLVHYSSDYGSAHQYTVEPYMRSKKSEMPAWMVQTFESVNWRPSRIPLHAAQSVKVSKVAGKACE